MIGIGTALADDPLLTCRLPGMEANSPVRVVHDSALRLPPSSRLAQTAREVPVWVLTASEGPAAALQAAGVAVMRVAGGKGGRLDLSAVLKVLAERGVTRLMVEGGPTLAAALVAADLVDEAVLFQSPKIVGTEGIDALEGMPLTALTQSPRLVSVRCGAVGVDSYEHFERR
jgi:diaminohydroxyphosphoribosylaminopyrimidine deaminase/5-amino-6-(5-phosphoribosylamino)uracil reductase